MVSGQSPGARSAVTGLIAMMRRVSKPTSKTLAAAKGGATR